MAKKPPRILWHYTRRSLLAPLLTGRALRMGHADHLNDPDERRLLFQAWDKLLEEQYPSFVEPYGSSQWPEGRERLLAPFITAFSSNPDNLLLWSAYAKEPHERAVGTGVAIGFYRDVLLEAKVMDGLGPARPFASSVDRSVTLRPVTYGRKKPRKEAERLLEEFTRVYVSNRRLGGTGLSATRDLLLRNALMTAATFKTAGWKQEEEWRLLWRCTGIPADLMDVNLQVREDATCLWRSSDETGQEVAYVVDQEGQGSPFVTVPFEPSEAIARIIVGPCGDEVSVKQTLKDLDVWVPVVKSPTLYNAPRES